MDLNDPTKQLEEELDSEISSIRRESQCCLPEHERKNTN